MPANQSKERISIERGKWWGWQEAPPRNPGWGASPIFVTNLTPLKTGKSVLLVEFIQVMHPRKAVRRIIDLKVVYRTSTHLVGTFVGDDGAPRTALLSEMSCNWFRSDVPLLWERRPPLAEWLMGEAALPEPDFEEYLAMALGRSEEDILNGATAKSVPPNSEEKPTAFSHFAVDRIYSAFASWLINRGFTPRSMDDRWLIYLEAGTLIFRRSWTGILIYDVEAQWRADQLYLGQAKVNRDKRQYGNIDDEYDKQLLTYLIDSILIGIPATFPFKDE